MNELEAGEAIAKSLAANYGIDWDAADEYERGKWTSAVAHVMAQTWDEGWDGGAGWPQKDLNPYRSHG